MKQYIVLTISTCFLIPFNTESIEIYQDDINSVALRGYISGVYLSNETTNEINEGISRWGFDIQRKLDASWSSHITLEWGLNFDKNTNFTVAGSSNAPQGSANDAMFVRLGNIKLSHEKWGSIAIGKQWSAYYDMTSGTDILNMWGASASGSFNFNSDGGISGTGRAEQSVIWRNKFSNINIAVQIQAQDEIVEIDSTSQDNKLNIMEDKSIATIGNGIGISAQYALEKLSFKFGYNRNSVKLSPNSGIQDTHDSIGGVSINYGTNNKEGWYASAMFAKSNNHEVDDLGRYFNAKHAELIVKYTFENNTSIYTGFNHLAPDDSTYDSQYQFHYNFAGLEYLLFKKAAKTFIEVRTDDITLSDGSQNSGTQVAIGLTLFL